MSTINVMAGSVMLWTHRSSKGPGNHVRVAERTLSNTMFSIKENVLSFTSAIGYFSRKTIATFNGHLRS